MGRKPWHKQRRRKLRENRPVGLVDEEFPVNHLALVTDPDLYVERYHDSLDRKSLQYLKQLQRKCRRKDKNLLRNAQRFVKEHPSAKEIPADVEEEPDCEISSKEATASYSECEIANNNKLPLPPVPIPEPPRQWWWFWN